MPVKIKSITTLFLSDHSSSVSPFIKGQYLLRILSYITPSCFLLTFNTRRTVYWFLYVVKILFNTPNSKPCWVGVQLNCQIIDSVTEICFMQLDHTREDTGSYPRTGFLCSVLHLGEQIYQIRYFLALSDRRTGGVEAAGRGGGCGHHSAATCGAGLQPNSSSFKNRRALSVGTGQPAWPFLPGQLLPDCPLQGAGAGESSVIQCTGEPLQFSTRRTSMVSRHSNPP